MKGFYKFCLGAGLIGGVLCYGIHNLKSKSVKILQRYENLEQNLSQIETKLDQLQEVIVRRQILSPIKNIRKKYDKNRNDIIDKEEYCQYLRDTSEVDAILRDYDADEDGLLGGAEISKLIRNYTSAEAEPLLVASVFKHVLKKYDKDRNSILDRIELCELSRDFEIFLD